MTTCGSIEDIMKKKGEAFECNFFASAENYQELSVKAHDVAKEITRNLDLVTCAELSALIGTPVAMAMCLPCVLWFLSCTGMTIYKRRREANNNARDMQKNRNGALE